MNKAYLRQYMKDRRSDLTKEQTLLQSKKIHEKLKEIPEYRECSNLFSYLSFGAEVDTWDILGEFLMNKSEECRVFIPRVEGKKIEFYQVEELNLLKQNSMGILQPVPGIHRLWYDTVNKDGIKVMLFPGLAFDPAGSRIGYGAGYYDRFMRENEDQKFIKIALAFDFQVTDKIDAQEHDVPVDFIVTPEKIIRCRL